LPAASCDILNLAVGPLDLNLLAVATLLRRIAAVIGGLI
jgi:hypothetical protein